MSKFSETGIREVSTSFSNEIIENAKYSWKAFVSSIQEYPDTYEGKGIVICAGGVKYITCAWVLISMLRYQKCKLPIELWYAGNEVSQEMMSELAKFDVECKNIYGFVKEASGVAMKPLAILYSKFKEVLFLDADNITANDPSYIFEDSNYKKHGTIFWPDFWKTPKNNPIWDILEVPFLETAEQESGQILINKSLCWRELNLCIYLNLHSHIYYKLLYGDKDTFKFAWLALKTEYYMIATDTASCGYQGKNEVFNGITMVQHDPLGNILFLHRNLIKWDVTFNTEMFWDKIKKFKEDSTSRKYYLRTGEKFHIAIDIDGETELLDFRIKFPKLEKKCLYFLNKLRRSGFYQRFLLFEYMKTNRLSNG
ncbi:alpha 1,2-mannosyltransferase [Mucilaginibacter oryzae]|uniref:Alpha 1,2-mannosyltransferase n=1 Tax=Mucilaginibacter oryzae TaxID=468058 RepID=A0A316GTM5_9SPHI|nr:hypothetical protein [Mucilaginibacter oryzae]PWK65388.1 alpha 1,2-mannosyltransferase [Mucilaginibacter oryzae]